MAYVRAASARLLRFIFQFFVSSVVHRLASSLIRKSLTDVAGMVRVSQVAEDVSETRRATERVLDARYFGSINNFDAIRVFPVSRL